MGEQYLRETVPVNIACLRGWLAGNGYHKRRVVFVSKT